MAPAQLSLRALLELSQRSLRGAGSPKASKRRQRHCKGGRTPQKIYGIRQRCEHPPSPGLRVPGQRQEQEGAVLVATGDTEGHGGIEGLGN